MRDARYRPHDLVKLRRRPTTADAPAWLEMAFAQAPFAVVRRAFSPVGRIAVGWRGRARGERYAALADDADVEFAIPPERLLETSAAPARADLPPFVLLRMLTESAGLRGCDWGPTGSAGFELATGLPTITATSDLDILIRAPRALSHEAAQALLAELQACASQAGVRIDAQLDTPAGGVSLIEWAASKARTMVKGAQGPYLAADPWGPRDAQPEGAPVADAMADQ